MRPLIFRSILASLVLISGVTGFAQRSGLGLKGGFSMNDLRSEIQRYDLAPGGSIGAYLPYRIGNKMEIQPEVLFTGYGVTRSLNEGDRTTMRTYYLQIPASIKFFMSNSFNMQFGVQAGKLLMATDHGSEGPSNDPATFNNMDFGLLAGAGMDLASGLDLTLRYYHGESAILANDQSIFPRYRVLQFTVGKRILRFNTQKSRRRR